MYHLKSSDTLDLLIFLIRQRLEVKTSVLKINAAVEAKVKAAAKVNTFCEGGLLAFGSVMARNAGIERMILVLRLEHCDIVC
jgi:hypothetical protein